MIVEATIIGILLASGVFTVVAAGLKGWAILPLGFLAGLALFVSLGFVYALLGAPGPPSILLGVTLIVPMLLWLRVRTRHDLARIRLRTSALAAGSVVCLVAVFWWANLVKYHFDSLRYLMAGTIFFKGHLDALSMNLAEKRFSSVAILHSTAGHFGDVYLRSLTPLTSLALLGALYWIIDQGLRDRLPSRARYAFAGGAVLILITNHGFLWHSVYINGHLLFGAQFMLLVGVGWLLTARPSGISSASLLTVQCLAIMGTVFTRPEGLFLVGVALIPVALSQKLPVRYRVAPWINFGVATVISQAFIARFERSIAGDVSPETFRLILSGVLAILVGCFLAYRPLRERVVGMRRWLLRLAELGLWSVLGLYWIRDPEVLHRSLEATFENVVRGAGRWGPALVVLGALVGVAVLRRLPSEVQLRFPVTTFVPLVLLFAYLREGAYRVGVTDSLNRMFMQILPLAVLYVVLALALGRWRWSGPMERPDHRRQSPRAVEVTH